MIQLFEEQRNEDGVRVLVGLTYVDEGSGLSGFNWVQTAAHSNGNVIDDYGIQHEAFTPFDDARPGSIYYLPPDDIARYTDKETIWGYASLLFYDDPGGFTPFLNNTFFAELSLVTMGTSNKPARYLTTFQYSATYNFRDNYGNSHAIPGSFTQTNSPGYLSAMLKVIRGLAGLR